MTNPTLNTAQPLMHPASRPIAGIVVTVLAMVTLAGADAVSKHLTSLAPLMVIVWARYLIFFLYGVTAAACAPGPTGFQSKRPGLQIARASCLVIGNIAIIYGFSQLPLADVHAMLAVAPLIVTLGSGIFLAERVSADRWLAVAIGFIGILIIVRPATSVFDPVAIFPLIGSTMFAAYQIMTRVVSRIDSQATTQFFTGTTGFFWFSVLTVYWWESLPVAVWLLMLIGGAINVFSHLLIIRGLHWAPASTLQPFHYSMFVAAVVFGYLVFDELPDAYTVIGATIVILSGVYSLYRAR